MGSEEDTRCICLASSLLHDIVLYMTKKDKNGAKVLSTKTKFIKFLVYFVLIGLPTFLVFYFGFLMFSDIRTNRAIKDKGVETIATVTARDWGYGLKTHRGWAPDRHTVDYDFTYIDNQGRSSRQTSEQVEVSETLYDSVEKGSTLQVTYLPENPSVNLPSDEVGKASQMTKLILVWVFGLPLFYLLLHAVKPFEKKHVPRGIYNFMFRIIILAVAISIGVLLTYLVVVALY